MRPALLTTALLAVVGLFAWLDRPPREPDVDLELLRVEAELEKRLQEPLVVRIKDGPFEPVLRQLAYERGLPIHPLSKLKSTSHVTSLVHLQLVHPIPLELVLNHLTEQAEKAWSVREGQLCISDRHDVSCPRLRVYSMTGIDIARTSENVMGYIDRYQYLDLRMPYPARPCKVERSCFRRSLETEQIVDTLRGFHLHELDGPTSFSDSQANRQVRRQLEDGLNRIVSVSYRDADWQIVLDELSRMLGANVVLDREATDPSTALPLRVTLQVRDVSLRSLLRLLAAQHRMFHEIRDGVYLLTGDRLSLPMFYPLAAQTDPYLRAIIRSSHSMLHRLSDRVQDGWMIAHLIEPHHRELAEILVEQSRPGHARRSKSLERILDALEAPTGIAARGLRLRDALEQIASRHQINLVYESALMPASLDRAVDLRAELPLGKQLLDVLDRQGLHFEVAHEVLRVFPSDVEPWGDSLRYYSLRRFRDPDIHPEADGLTRFFPNFGSSKVASRWNDHLVWQGDEQRQASVRRLLNPQGPLARTAWLLGAMDWRERALHLLAALGHEDPAVVTFAAAHFAYYRAPGDKARSAETEREWYEVVPAKKPILRKPWPLETPPTAALLQAFVRDQFPSRDRELQRHLEHCDLADEPLWHALRRWTPDSELTLVLVAMLACPDSQATAVQGLKLLGEGAVEQIAAEVRDEYSTCRDLALAAGEIDFTLLVSRPLWPLLDDANPQVRRFARRMLRAQTFDHQTLLVLLERSRTGSPAVRRQSCRVLGELDFSMQLPAGHFISLAETIELLREVGTNDSDPKVRDTAAAAVTELRKQQLP